MKLEFTDMEEYIKYMAYFCAMREPAHKTEVEITREYDENQRWLNNNYLEQQINDLHEEIGVIASETQKPHIAITGLTNKLTELQNQINILNEGKIKALTDRLTDLEKQAVKPVKKQKPKKQIGKRKYGQSYQKPYTITRLLDNGYFKLENHTSIFNITDVLKLKNMMVGVTGTIPYSKWSKKFRFGFSTLATICWNIDNGIFDKWINEWEQKQANNFYNNANKKLIVNNPQKRKELNGMG